MKHIKNNFNYNHPKLNVFQKKEQQNSLFLNNNVDYTSSSSVDVPKLKTFPIIKSLKNDQYITSSNDNLLLQQKSFLPKLENNVYKRPESHSLDHHRLQSHFSTLTKDQLYRSLSTPNERPFVSNKCRKEKKALENQQEWFNNLLKSNEAYIESNKRLSYVKPLSTLTAKQHHHYNLMTQVYEKNNSYHKPYDIFMLDDNIQPLPTNKDYYNEISRKYYPSSHSFDTIHPIPRQTEHHSMLGMKTTPVSTSSHIGFKYIVNAKNDQPLLNNKECNEQDYTDMIRAPKDTITRDVFEEQKRLVKRLNLYCDHLQEKLSVQDKYFQIQKSDVEHQRQQYERQYIESQDEIQGLNQKLAQITIQLDYQRQESQRLERRIVEHEQIKNHLSSQIKSQGQQSSQRIEEEQQKTHQKQIELHQAIHDTQHQLTILEKKHQKEIQRYQQEIEQMKNELDTTKQQNKNIVIEKETKQAYEEKMNDLQKELIKFKTLETTSQNEIKILQQQYTVLEKKFQEEQEHYNNEKLNVKCLENNLTSLKEKLRDEHHKKISSPSYKPLPTSPKQKKDYESQIEVLQKENEELKARLLQFVPEAERKSWLRQIGDALLLKKSSSTEGVRHFDLIKSYDELLTKCQNLDIENRGLKKQLEQSNIRLHDTEESNQNNNTHATKELLQQYEIELVQLRLEAVAWRKPLKEIITKENNSSTKETFLNDLPLNISLDELKGLYTTLRIHFIKLYEDSKLAQNEISELQRQLQDTTSTNQLNMDGINKKLQILNNENQQLKEEFQKKESEYMLKTNELASKNDEFKKEIDRLQYEMNISQQSLNNIIESRNIHNQNSVLIVGSINPLESNVTLEEAINQHTLLRLEYLKLIEAYNLLEQKQLQSSTEVESEQRHDYKKEIEILETENHRLQKQLKALIEATHFENREICSDKESSKDQERIDQTWHKNDDEFERALAESRKSVSLYNEREQMLHSTITKLETELIEYQLKESLYDEKEKNLTNYIIQLEAETFTLREEIAIWNKSTNFNIEEDHIIKDLPDDLSTQEAKIYYTRLYIDYIKLLNTFKNLEEESQQQKLRNVELESQNREELEKELKLWKSQKDVMTRAIEEQRTEIERLQKDNEDWLTKINRMESQLASAKTSGSLDNSMEHEEGIIQPKVIQPVVITHGEKVIKEEKKKTKRKKKSKVIDDTDQLDLVEPYPSHENVILKSSQDDAVDRNLTTSLGIEQKETQQSQNVSEQTVVGAGGLQDWFTTAFNIRPNVISSDVGEKDQNADIIQVVKHPSKRDSTLEQEEEEDDSVLPTSFHGLLNVWGVPQLKRQGTQKSVSTPSSPPKLRQSMEKVMASPPASTTTVQEFFTSWGIGTSSPTVATEGGNEPPEKKLEDIPSSGMTAFQNIFGAVGLVGASSAPPSVHEDDTTDNNINNNSQTTLSKQDDTNSQQPLSTQNFLSVFGM